MSRNASFRKFSEERLRYTLSYERWVDDGEVLDDYDIVIEPVTLPLLVADGAFLSVDNLRVSAYLSGGLPDTVYTVSFIATTDQGQVKRNDVQLQVI